MFIIKNILKNEVGSMIIILLIGLILIIFPIESINMASYIISGLFIIGGLSNILYFLIDKNPKMRIDTLYFIISISSIVLGIYTFINPTWLITVLNIIVGIFLIISAVNNLRYLFKYNKRNTLWWVFTIITFIIIILGVIAIIKPIEVASIIIRFEGLSLVFDAIASLLIIRRFTKLIPIK